MSHREKYIELSEPEYDELLQKSKYHEKPEYREKCRALLLNHSGVSIKLVASHLKMHKMTIGTWIIGWKKDKFERLIRKKGQGCKPILVANNPAHVKLIHEAVSTHRQDINGIRTELIKALIDLLF